MRDGEGVVIEDPTARPAERGGVWTAVAGMLALAASLGIGRFVYTPILPSMAAALHLSGGAAGLIASANFAGYLTGALLATARRFPGGPRPWFVGGLAVGAATTIGMAAVSGMPSFLLLRFLGGAATAFVLVLGTASVLDRLARSQDLWWRWLHYAGVGFGIATSSVLVSGLDAAGAGWRVLWLCAGLLAAIMCVAPSLSLRWRAPADPGSHRAAPGRAAPGLAPLALCHGLFGFGYVVTATFLVAMIRADPSARALEPAVWLVVGLTAIPSTLVWDIVAARIGTRPAYGAACVVQAAGVAASGVWPSAASALLGAAFLGATIMGLTSLGFAVARELGPGGQARRFAVITASFGVGQVIGPVVGGSLFDHTGNYVAASAVAASVLVAAAFVIVLSNGRQAGWRTRT